MGNYLHTTRERVCNGGPQPATAYDVDICVARGSVALFPVTKEAKTYCATALSGWSRFGNVYFIPRLSSDLIMRILTKRFCCRIDGEIVS
jgi:hypothetical protein